MISFHPSQDQGCDFFTVAKLSLDREEKWLLEGRYQSARLPESLRVNRKGRFELYSDFRFDFSYQKLLSCSELWIFFPRKRQSLFQCCF